MARLPTNYTPFEKVLLAAYEGLLTTEPLTQEREIKLYAPIPILKPILTSKPLRLIVVQESAVQRWALYILHQVTSDGINKEIKLLESVELIGMPTEYSHLPSSTITDVLPWEGDTKKFGSQWPANWVKNNQQVNGRDVWGKTHWKKHTGKRFMIQTNLSAYP